MCDLVWNTMFEYCLASKMGTPDSMASNRADEAKQDVIRTHSTIDLTASQLLSLSIPAYHNHCRDYNAAAETPCIQGSPEAIS